MKNACCNQILIHILKIQLAKILNIALMDKVPLQRGGEGEEQDKQTEELLKVTPSKQKHHYNIMQHAKTTALPHDSAAMEIEEEDEGGGASGAESDSSSQSLSCSSSNKSQILQHEEQAKNNNDKELIHKPINMMKRQTLIPEALPLFSLPTQSGMLEPEAKFKLNRMNINRRITMDVTSTNLTNAHLKRLHCKHLKLLKDNQCLDCQAYLPHFQGSLFDTGGITTFLNIKYVNEFFDELRQAQLTENHTSSSLRDKPKIIYENYKPKNIHEMREYLLYVIDKSLKKAAKKGQLSSDHIKILGQPGCGKNLSSELLSYKFIKKNRERSVLCQNVEQLPKGGSEIAKKPSNNQMNSTCNDTPTYYQGIGPHCLLFDSFFECGNLERAEYVSPTEYNLYLNVDTNTKGHQQWFYFKVKNTFKDKKYTFNIRNFTKPFSLHRQGMKILMKSKKKGLADPIMDEQDCWVQLKEEAVYVKSSIQRSGWRIPGAINLDDEEDDDQILDDINGLDGIGTLGGVDRKTIKKQQAQQLTAIIGQSPPPQMKRRRRYFYCLTFKVEFEYDDDQVFFAYSTPYTYSRMYIQMINNEQALIQSQKQTKSLASDLKVNESSDKMTRQIVTKELIYERSMMAKTLSGLPVPLITMTARRHNGMDIKKRQGICISARVHPGETNSNFVFDGIIKHLMTSEGIVNLLHNYVFKLVPCLNPDGNVCGNYRSSLAGVDLNRQWIYPNRDIHPVVFKAKEMLQNFSKERELLVYCDLHCHSKKMNSFIYGCNTAANGGFTSWTKTRLLPRILAKHTPLFNIQDCRFRVDPDKLGTARVIIWKEFGVTNSFTLENSFFGYQRGIDSIPFTPRSYMEIGESLMKALVEYRFCLKQIEKELIVTQGWLKPRLLLEVTGTPAAKRIADEQAEQIKKEQKQRKIEQYKQSLGITGDGKKVDSKFKGAVPTKTGSGTNQPEVEKTRNIQRTNTLGQNVVSPMTANSSSEALQSKGALLRQNSNQSDTRLGLRQVPTAKGEKRQSSSDSTNDFSMRKFSMTFKSGGEGEAGVETPKRPDSNQNSSKFGKNNRPRLQGKINSSFKSNQLNRGNQQKNGSFHKQEPLRDGTPPQNNQQPNISIKVKPGHRRGSSQFNSKLQKGVAAETESGDGSNGGGAGRYGANNSMDWRAYFMGEDLEEIYEQIEEGDDPNEIEADMSLSEDNASDDNFDMDELYNDLYMRGHLLEEEIKEAKEAEEVCKREIEIQIEETRQQAQSRKKHREEKIAEMKFDTDMNDRSESFMKKPPAAGNEGDNMIDLDIANKDVEKEILSLILEKDPYDQGVFEDEINKKGGSKVQITHNKNYPHLTNRRVTVPTPMEKRPISQSITQQIMVKQGGNEGGFFTSDDPMRYQQVLDTSFPNRDFHIVNPKTHLLQTFLNQQQVGSSTYGKHHLNSNQKVLYRKNNNNMDFRIPSRGIQGKSMNVNFAQPAVHRFHETKYHLKGGDPLQHINNEMATINHSSLAVNLNASIGSNHPISVYNAGINESQQKQKASGFQQYIMNNIKNENPNIREAYSKFNNYSLANQSSLKISSMTVNEASFDHKTATTKDDLPFINLNDSIDASHLRVNDSIQHDSHQFLHYSDAKYPPSKSNFFQSPPPPLQQNNAPSIIRASQASSVLQPQAAMKQTIRTPLIGIKNNTSAAANPIHSPKQQQQEVLMSNSVKNQDPNAFNPIFPALKQPHNFNVSSLAQETRQIKEMMQQQQQLRQMHKNAQHYHNSSRRETMTDIGAQIVISGATQIKVATSERVTAGGSSLSHNHQIPSAQKPQRVILSMQNSGQKLHNHNNSMTIVENGAAGGLNNLNSVSNYQQYSFSTAKKRDHRKYNQLSQDVSGLEIVGGGGHGHSLLKY